MGVENPSTAKLPMTMSSGGGASTSVFSDSSVISLGDRQLLSSRVNGEGRCEEREEAKGEGQEICGAAFVAANAGISASKTAVTFFGKKEEEEDQYYQQFVSEMKKRQEEEEAKAKRIEEKEKAARAALAAQEKKKHSEMQGKKKVMH